MPARMPARFPSTYLASLCLLSIVSSKLVHLHHYYSWEVFAFADVLFLPSFFLYETVAFAIVRVCLNGGHWNTKEHSIGPRATVLRSAGLALTVAILFFAAADVYVYLDFGGLCSWPTVLEVISSPRSLFAFFFQWMSRGEIWLISALAPGSLFAAYCLHKIQALGNSRLGRVPIMTARASLLLAMSISVIIVQGQRVSVWRGTLLLALSSLLWCWLLQRTISPAASHRDRVVSRLPAFSDEDIKRHTQKFTSNCATALAVVDVVILAICFRPAAFDDISATVPSSVAFALFGSTADLCPVGKPWPDVTPAVRYDLLDVAVANPDLERVQHAVSMHNLSSYWQPNSPPTGFEMFSPPRLEHWSSWHERDDITGLGSPPGYHYLFDEEKVSNLEEEILPGVLKGRNLPGHGQSKLKLRNVVFVVMESTSAHTFPMEPGSEYYERTMRSRLPGKSYSDIEGLMPTAERLLSSRHASSDSAGLLIQGAQTASSYTLKSLLASHCGMTPLPMDFTREAEEDAHFYQPCLPHILEALPNLTQARGEIAKWNMLYSMSVTDRFDRQRALMAKMGFILERDMLVKRDMDGPDVRHPVPDMVANARVANYQYPEKYLTPYLRDFFKKSRATGRPFFLSHLTSTSHPPWDLPPDWEMREFGEDERMNRLLNAMAYQDEWLTELMQTMEDEGVLDETLLVITADHASSIADGDLKLSFPFHNPHVNNFRIPMLFYNPRLPRITIAANVTTLSVLPTVLDLLIHAEGPLGNTEREFLRELLPSYEGQSLIRPIRFEHPQDDPSEKKEPALQFSLLNPGRGHVVVYSADPAVPWRMSIPLCHPGTFTAGNINEDPLEERVVRTVALDRLVQRARVRWGQEAAGWFEMAAARAARSVGEISRRWGVDHRSPPGELVRMWT